MDCNKLIALAYEEDIGTGDLTTQYLDLPKRSTAHLITKENGIICGLCGKTAFIISTQISAGSHTKRWNCYKWRYNCKGYRLFLFNLASRKSCIKLCSV